MGNFRELTEVEQDALRKVCLDQFNEVHGLDGHFDEEDPPEEGDPLYESYMSWYWKKVSIADATTLQGFVDISGNGNQIYTEHIRVFDVDHKISDQMLKACEEGDVQIVEEVFNEYYGIYVEVQ